MPGADYGSTFAAWREASPSWHDYVHHPFVRQLGDGSLPRQSFLSYLRQDYLFLFHFSRAWALAAVKAETLEEMKAAASAVHALVTLEMPLHVRICAEAGISEAELQATEEASANLAYTRYVLEAGYSGDFLDLMAALSPCVMGYGEIGLRLARERAADTPYRDWIDTYSGEPFQQLCRDTGALIDCAVQRRLGPRPWSSPRWTRLARHFETAARLEIGFWGLGEA